MFKKRSIRLTALLAGLLLTTAAQALEPADLQQYWAVPTAAGTPACPQLAGAASPAGQRLQAFYQQHRFQPRWDAASLQQLAQQLAALADDGMAPQRYPLPAESADPLCRELLASQSWLQALDELANGVLPQPLPAIWQAAEPPPRIDPLALARASTLADSFAHARPALPLYQQLRSLYASLRQQPLPDWPVLEPGPLLKPGQNSPRVPALATRLATQGYLADSELARYAQTPLFDEPLAQALRQFQSRHSLQEDGLLGPDTLRELNISPAMRLQQLRINLERWRWLHRELEADLLLVDIAGQEATLYRQGQPVWNTRLQVGRAERQTPQLRSRLSRLTLNPTWTVPPTILRKDKLPEIRRDIGYLQRNQMRVLDHNGRELDPHSIDWWNPRGILLRQDAGPHNALGQIAFRFDNPFAVYLHDTPSQQLFDKRPRVFSSGCVRVENAMTLRDHLLAALEPAERERVLQLQASGKTHEYRLTERLPLLLAYWTVSVDAQGLLLRPDLYALDPALAAALSENDKPSTLPASDNSMTPEL